MGRITEDMTRLVGEIQAGHADRKAFVRDLKSTVASMRSANRAANEERARTVRRLLKETADDLAGARRAWVGVASMAMPGRARRGSKWPGSESS